MGSRKRCYCEGDWFCVPIQQDRYVVGVIARVAVTKKIMFGYFFAPSICDIPELFDYEICQYNYQQSIFSCLFGNLGFVKEEWPIIGLCDNWNMIDWPLPLFKRVDPITGTTWLDELDEDTLTSVINTITVKDGRNCDGIPEHSVYGHKALEITLRKLIGSET